MRKLRSLIIAGVFLLGLLGCRPNSGQSPLNVSTSNPQTSSAPTNDGKDLTWSGNGLTWTVPVNWTVLVDRPDMFTFGDVKGAVSPGVCNAGLSPVGDQTQAKAILGKHEQSLRDNVKNGSVADFQPVVIAGFDGFEFVDVRANSDGWRKQHFLGIRQYKGQYQFLDLICGAKESVFQANKATYYSVVHSMNNGK